ncbi:MAG: xanthine dehydrogenase family protein molybdopterin-binding subunit [Povalibacter sp.]
MDRITESKVIGVATPRIDGALKVSGIASYASDHHFEGLLHAIPVCATIGNGTVTKIDTTAAEKMTGVVAVYHRGNIGTFYRVAPSDGGGPRIDETRPPLEDDVIRYYGQYVAVVVAQTLEQARAAAEQVKVSYRSDRAEISRKLLNATPAPEAGSDKSKRGDVDGALQKAAVKLDETYSTPVETHNPIELHASVAVYDGKSFTLYETSQAVVNHRDVMAHMLGVPTDQVKVVTKFLGSGFGGKLWPWPHALLAAACARNLKRPVKLVVTRQMMFHSTGHRPVTDQRIRLGAESNGKLIALSQEYANHTAISDDYSEDCGEATPFMYSTPNLKVSAALARRKVGTPTPMRGPGAVPGLFALESAMDELAIKLNMDPVQLRLMNEPSIDESKNLPFSSRHLKECLTTGADKFGWSQRTAGIGSMKRDGMTIGWGVAACSWGAMRADAEVTVEFRQDGRIRVVSATQDIGTGTYTLVAQIVSHATGVPVDRIDVVLGDSSLPPGPISGGSWVSASMTPATLQAAQNATKSLLSAAVKLQGPFYKKQAGELELSAGAIRAKAGGQSVAVSDVMRAGKIQVISGHGKSTGTLLLEQPKFSSLSFGAHCGEVTWLPEIARLRVSRVVTVIDAGRMINPRPARNQIEGAVVMGVGMALLEETLYDARNGKPVNDNLADYLVATHADAPHVDVTFLDYPDYNLNEIGARGVGEIGLAGIAAAITNAVYHATGLRVRNLPVRIEDLLTAQTKSVA